MIRNDLDSREVKDFKVSEKIREALKQIATLSLVNNYLIPFILIKRWQIRVISYIPFRSKTMYFQGLQSIVTVAPYGV